MDSVRSEKRLSRLDSVDIGDTGGDVDNIVDTVADNLVDVVAHVVGHVVAHAHRGEGGEGHGHSRYTGQAHCHHIASSNCVHYD